MDFKYTTIIEIYKWRFDSIDRELYLRKYRIIAKNPQENQMAYVRLDLLFNPKVVAPAL